MAKRRSKGQRARRSARRAREHVDPVEPRRPWRPSRLGVVWCLVSLAVVGSAFVALMAADHPVLAVLELILVPVVSVSGYAFWIGRHDPPVPDSPWGEPFGFTPP